MRAVKQLPSALERHLDYLIGKVANEDTKESWEKLKYCMKIAELGRYDIRNYKEIYQELKGGLRKR